MSLRTERSYLDWIRRYIRYHGSRHPRELGPGHIESFLSMLATESHVSESTQNQALSALLTHRQVFRKSTCPGSTRSPARAARSACRWCSPGRKCAAC
ncbi:MAG: phage integrase N-terminal SAM-like domain-containing protein [Steroidobacteraceae bacterium]|nr:phage integrase N-terminal SAM-like domain-containing protein [Steroidobacteraceae bacterium]